MKYTDLIISSKVIEKESRCIDFMEFFILALLAYLLGSIPSALLVGKIGFKLDIREHGSGNMGATNTFRVDRKSTRLNSSHVAISYAVFCLKKNTQTSQLK